MPHNGLNPYLSLLDKKIKLDRRTHRCWLCCFDKQTTQAQIPNSRCLLTFVRTPRDPNVHLCLDPRKEPPGIRRFLHSDCTLRTRSKASGNKNIFNPVNSRILHGQFPLVWVRNPTLVGLAPVFRAITCASPERHPAYARTLGHFQDGRWNLYVEGGSG